MNSLIDKYKFVIKYNHNGVADITTDPELQPAFIKVLLRVPKLAFFTPFPILNIKSLPSLLYPRTQLFRFCGVKVHLASNNSAFYVYNA